MQEKLAWLQARANDIGSALVGLMFLAFMVQIFSRYVLGNPVGWTLELCLTAWLWAVFWGSAFCLKDHDHIRFDMLYQAVGPRTRRVFAAISALCIMIALASALPRTWDFVSFLSIKKSATFRVPLAWVFSVYIVFMVATIGLYAHRLRKVWRNDPDLDPPPMVMS